jgi:peptide/nickel transport system permease protein
MTATAEVPGAQRQRSRRRANPAWVNAAAALLVLQALPWIAAGFLKLFSDSDTFEFVAGSGGQSIALGLLFLIIGLGVGGVAYGLLQMQSWAWWAGISAAFVLGLYHLLKYVSDTGTTGNLIFAILAAAVLGVLARNTVEGWEQGAEAARLILRRVIQLIVVMFLVVTFTFFLIRLLPGDPVDTIVPNQIGEQGKQAAAAVREDLGLDQPLIEQYTDYVTGILSGDLGRNYATNVPVTDTLNQALPVSLQLMIYAQFLALLFAIPLGVLTAYRTGTKTDRGINMTAFAFLALPNFVLALLLSYIVGVELGWLPTAGYAPGWLDQLFDPERVPEIADHIQFMLLPAITLAVGQIAVYMRLLRSDMIATLQENFITMAKSKGISNSRILWRHALRPSSLTLLTVAGLNVGTLIGGAVVVEVIFQLPGMGLKIFQAISARQYIELQSFILVIAFFFVMVNFFVDFLYTVLDPRIRRARAAT